MALFVGAFSRSESGLGLATSAAGDQVQDEIVRGLVRYFEPRGISTHAIVLTPVPSWPRGPLLVNSFKLDNVFWPAFLNIPIFKQLCFSICLIVSLVQRRPKHVFFYNGDLFSCLTAIAYKLFCDKTRIIGIVQDVLTYPGCSRLKALSYSTALRLLRFFDLVVPISRDIVADFNLKEDRVVVFRGGLSRQSARLRDYGLGSIDPRIAVFAGALESYNGVDRLVDLWPNSGDLELHVFGKGACECFVRDAASRNRMVIFHGQCTEAEVSSWLARSMVNFCLRYPLDIETKYFFPSKFFNIMAAPGIPVVNQFHGLPADASELCVVVSDDLSDFFKGIEEIVSAYNVIKIRSLRLEWLSANADWSKVLTYVIESRVEGYSE